MRGTILAATTAALNACAFHISRFAAAEAMQAHPDAVELVDGFFLAGAMATMLTGAFLLPAIACRTPMITQESCIAGVVERSGNRSKRLQHVAHALRWSWSRQGLLGVKFCLQLTHGGCAAMYFATIVGLVADEDPDAAFVALLVTTILNTMMLLGACSALVFFGFRNMRALGTIVACCGIGTALSFQLQTVIIADQGKGAGTICAAVALFATTVSAILAGFIPSSTRPYIALYPKHWKPNPRAPYVLTKERVEKEARRWVRECDVPKDVVDRALEKMDLRAFAQEVLPECHDEEKLFLVACYTLWLFLADDELESLVFANTDDKRREAEQLVEYHLAAIDYQQVLPRAAGPLCKVFAEINRKLGEWLRCDNRNEQFFQQWRHAHKVNLEGVLEEGRRGDNLPMLLQRKIAVTAIQVFFVLNEVMCPGANLSPEVEGSPVIQHIQRLGSLIGGLFNDVMSFRKEAKDAAHTNVALGLRDYLGYDEEAACTLDYDLHNVLIHEYDRAAEAALEKYSGAENVRRYIQCGRHLVVGLAHWQVDTPRYQGGVVIVDDPSFVNQNDSDELRDLVSLAMDFITAK